MTDSNRAISAGPEKQERTEDALRSSEARWRTVLENSTVGIALTDMEGRFEITNGVYQRLLGYSEEEMRQITFLDVTAPEFREQNWKLISECLAGKRKQFDIEKQYKRKDGSLVWVRNNVLLVPGADGKPRHILAISENISARKRAEESLRASEEWRSVFDNTAVGIALLDASENHVATNSAYQRMLGYSEKELQRLSYQDVTHEEDVKAGRDLFGQLVEDKYRQLHIEKRCRRKDGTVVWVKTGVSRVLGTEGRTGLFAAVVADITERKRAEEALRRSEAYLAEAQKLSRTGSWHWNIASGEVMWSQELFAILGFDSQQHKSSYQSHLARIHPEDSSRVEGARLAAIGKRGQFEAEYRLLMPGGEVKRVQDVGYCLVDKAGDVEYIGAVMDVTERKRAEEERERLREEQRVILEAASDVVLGVDEGGVIRYANPATNGVFGFDPKELIGKPLSVLMPESVRGRHENAFRRYGATGRRNFNWNGTEHTGLRKNGMEFPVEVSFGELTTNGHRVFTGFIRDITEKRRAEEERKRAAEALLMAQEKLAQAAQSAIIGQLAASIAHEINQPLAAVVANGHACVRWLSANPANLERARMTAEHIARDGKAAAEFVQRIRGLFKHATQEGAPVDIEEAILEVIGVMEDEITARGGHVETEFEKRLPPIIGDRIQIQQVVINLVRNALDAMECLDGQQRIVEIRARVEHTGAIAIEVVDRGCGVEDADKIFIPFYTTKKTGMGVGLSICRSIVDAHGGRLRAVRNEGRGSRFIVSLPAGTWASEARDAQCM